MKPTTYVSGDHEREVIGMEKKPVAAEEVCDMYIYVLSEFSFTDTEDSQDSREREETMFYSSLPLPSPLEPSNICLHLCMRYVYHVFFNRTICNYLTTIR